MIVKKIRRSDGQESAAKERRYHGVLTTYIARARAEDALRLAEMSDDPYASDLAAYVSRHGSQELVLDCWSINLLGDNHEDWIAEVNALHFRAGSPHKVTDHWVLSWDTADCPTSSEIKAAVATFLRCQGLENCAAIAAAHADTDNVHTHIAVTRIHHQVAGQGWDIDAGHRAKAVIEDMFPRWRREERSLYAVVGNELIETGSGAIVGPAGQPELWRRRADRAKSQEASLKYEALKLEAETGEQSASRVALEEAVPILRNASGWLEAHRLLASKGIGLERTRKGGLLTPGDRRVKLSIARDTSFSALEKKWGAYLEAPDKAAMGWLPRELNQRGTAIAAYYAEKNAFKLRLSRLSSSVHRLIAVTGAEAAEIDLSGMTFPTFDAWRAGAAPPDIAAHASSGAFVTSRSGARGKASVTDLPCLFAMKRRDVITYRSPRNPREVLIVDTGDHIILHKADRNLVRAALSIAVARWPGEPISVEGDKSVCRMVRAVAREMGIAITDNARALELKALPDETSKLMSDPPADFRTAQAENQFPSEDLLAVTDAQPTPDNSLPIPESSVRDDAYSQRRSQPTTPYAEWFLLREDEAQQFERDRSALMVQQDESSMTQAAADGFAEEVEIQARACLNRLAVERLRARGIGR